MAYLQAYIAKHYPEWAGMLPQNAANDADAERGNATPVRFSALRSSRVPSAADLTAPRSGPITRRHSTSVAIDISHDQEVDSGDPPSARDASARDASDRDASDSPASFASASENQENAGIV